MTENIKLLEPSKITEEILKECTCKIYNWSTNPCPYYADQPGHQNSDCNCCPYCYKKCVGSVKSSD